MAQEVQQYGNIKTRSTHTHACVRHGLAQSAKELIKVEQNAMLMITQSGQLSIWTSFSEPFFLPSQSRSLKKLARLRDFLSHGQILNMLHRLLGSATGWASFLSMLLFHAGHGVTQAEKCNRTSICGHFASWEC